MSLQLLFGSLFLQRFLLRLFFCGCGWRQVLWAEAEALQKSEDVAVLLLKLGDQVSFCADFVRKLKKMEYKNRIGKQCVESIIIKESLSVQQTTVTTRCNTKERRHDPNLQKRLELSERRLHEVLLDLSEGLYAVFEQLLGHAVELLQLVQELGVQRFVVVARHLQLVLDSAVLQAIGALLTVVVVQQLVEAFLDELVRPGEHDEELGERLDDQRLCALLLLRRQTTRHQSLFRTSHLS